MVPTVARLDRDVTAVLTSVPVVGRVTLVAPVVVRVKAFAPDVVKFPAMSMLPPRLRVLLAFSTSIVKARPAVRATEEVAPTETSKAALVSRSAKVPRPVTLVSPAIVAAVAPSDTEVEPRVTALLTSLVFGIELFAIAKETVTLLPDGCVAVEDRIVPSPVIENVLPVAKVKLPALPVTLKVEETAPTADRTYAVEAAFVLLSD
jgi:hypothetical protein